MKTLDAILPKTRLLFLSIILLISLLCIQPAMATDAWFSTYDISDESAVWADLIAPITVLDAGEKEAVYLLDVPNGKKQTKAKYAGYVNGASAAVRVIGEDEKGWTLVEGYDMRDNLIQGYVKTSKLKTVTPDQHIGIVVDKLTQRMYIFEDGHKISELLVSTGLPNKKQPYNETASGQYLCISWSGGFWSGNMWCDMAIRFNGGDKLHLVPALINNDKTKNYSPFETKLGYKASHGCIRVQRLKNSEGINMKWLWDNLRKGTKIMIWDDDGRVMTYPADDYSLYYNSNGGQYYHADANCPGVKQQYLPLTEFTYGELNEKPFSKLKPCGSCVPPFRKQE